MVAGQVHEIVRSKQDKTKNTGHGVPVIRVQMFKFKIQPRTADISVSCNIGAGDKGGGAGATWARYRLLIVTSKSRISVACRARSSLLLLLSLKPSNRRDRRSSTPDVGVGEPAFAVTSRKLGSTGVFDWSREGDDGGESLG